METKVEKTKLIFKTKDGKAYRVKDIVLAVAVCMSKPDYVQPVSYFLELAFKEDHELLVNAYHHFFVENPNELTRSVPFLSKNPEGNESEDDYEWHKKYGEGIEV